MSIAITQRRNPAALILFFAALLALSGCQEFQGPAWSPDGQHLAFTTYKLNKNKDGGIETNLYLLTPDAPNAEPIQLALDAACPRWVSDENGPVVYFLAKRDRQGCFTSLLRHRPGPGAGVIETVQEKIKLNSFQMSVDGSVAMLASGKDGTPGTPQTLEVWIPKGDKRSSLRQLGDVNSYALSPNGQVLAYTQVPKGGTKPIVAILELDRKDPTPRAVFPTQDADEPSAKSYVVHAFADNTRFLFYAPGGENVWTTDLDGKTLASYPLPAGYSAPLVASIGDDGKSAMLTLAKGAGGEIQYQVFSLDFRTKAFKPVGDRAQELIGGHSVDPRTAARPGNQRWAWLSEAGLALGRPEGTGKVRYYPRTGEQFLAASALYLKQGDNDDALAAALKAGEVQPRPDDLGAQGMAEARAYLATQKGLRAASSFERAYLLYPVRAEGVGFIFSANSGLPQAGAEYSEKLIADMEKYLAASPDDKLLSLLLSALQARANGNFTEALSSYRSAEQHCGSEDLVGGVKFLQGMTAFESGDLYMAGEHWEAAARSKEFPQADYAAGMSFISFMLDKRTGADRRAEGVFRVGLSRTKVLKDDLTALRDELAGKAHRQNRLSNEVKSADQTLRAWVDINEFLLPVAVLKPQMVLGADRKFAPRRLFARTVTASSVQVAGLPEGTKTLLRVPLPISVPQFAPNSTAAGGLLSFEAQGEVFPVANAYCEVYVVNLAGAVLRGNAEALKTSHLAARTVIAKSAWTGPNQLNVQGKRIDVFGNETPYQDTFTVAP